MKEEGESVMGALLYLFLGLLAVLGRIVGQMLSVRWALSNSRRELRSSTLVDAWQRLARMTSGPDADFQRALADIQLVGTPAQAELAASAVRSSNELASEAPSVQELLEALRVEVREEMGLGRARSPLAVALTGVSRDSGFARAPAERRPFAHELRGGRTSGRPAVRAKMTSLRVVQGQR
jgi:hypothetical protein